jgi:hypothetical protein
MKEHAESMLKRKLIVNRGESIHRRSAVGTHQKATCEDIARLALAMHDKKHFFSLRRSLEMRFSRDINGSGVQALEVLRTGAGDDSRYLFRVHFESVHRDSESFLYEADLIRDQGKDYEPTVNCGKHCFGAQGVWLQIDWSSDEVGQWYSDTQRLSTADPDSLEGWLESDKEMLVKCRAGFICGWEKVLARDDLARHANAGTSLEDLKARLTCSKCGKRNARILAL